MVVCYVFLGKSFGEEELLTFSFCFAEHRQQLFGTPTQEKPNNSFRFIPVSLFFVFWNSEMVIHGSSMSLKVITKDCRKEATKSSWQQGNACRRPQNWCGRLCPAVPRATLCWASLRPRPDSKVPWENSPDSAGRCPQGQMYYSEEIQSKIRRRTK